MSGHDRTDYTFGAPRPVRFGSGNAVRGRAVTFRNSRFVPPRPAPAGPGPWLHLAWGVAAALAWAVLILGLIASADGLLWRGWP